MCKLFKRWLTGILEATTLEELAAHEARVAFWLLKDGNLPQHQGEMRWHKASRATYVVSVKVVADDKLAVAVDWRGVCEDGRPTKCKALVLDELLEVGLGHLGDEVKVRAE